MLYVCAFDLCACDFMYGEKNKNRLGRSRGIFRFSFELIEATKLFPNSFDSLLSAVKLVTLHF